MWQKVSINTAQIESVSSLQVFHCGEFFYAKEGKT